MAVAVAAAVAAVVVVAVAAVPAAGLTLPVVCVYMKARFPSHVSSSIAHHFSF